MRIKSQTGAFIHRQSNRHLQKQYFGKKRLKTLFPHFSQMSVQEYEMIQEEDEHCLKRYRKQCMQEMHERLSFGPTFEEVCELETGEAFLEVIEKEHRLTLVVVHIYQHGVTGVFKSHMSSPKVEMNGWRIYF